MDEITTLMKNWTKFCDENPDIREAIKEGYEVAGYDEETGMIVAVEMVDGNLKMKIIEDSHLIRKTA